MLTATQVMQQARAAYTRGDLTQAEHLCRLILNAAADHFEALNLMGIIATQTQRAEEAANLMGRAVACKPLDARAKYFYANVLKELKRFDEALDQYQGALELAPGFAEVHQDRADLLTELGRLDEALQSYERALQIKPDSAAAHNNRGVALQALKRLDEALESHGRALKINPDYAEAFYNRGLTLRELGRFPDALESYDRALQIQPHYAEAHNNRGVALQALKRFAEAHESYERALKIRPDLAEAWYGRGNALSELGRFDEALTSYERALELAPSQAWLYGAWLITRMQLSDWLDFGTLVARLEAAIRQERRCTVPFPVIALVDSPSLQQTAAMIWASAQETTSLPPIERRPSPARLRLGYYSADFHTHATAHLMAELFERHDRTRFELVAFSFGPEVRDEMRLRLAAAFDRFLEVGAKSDREVAQISRELQIDIAVDLKGFTQHERHGIFAHRAAPIQVNFLGCPGTMGAQYLDYIVADSTLVPEESRRYYAEKVAYLPHSYQVNDRRRRIADKAFSRAELGLPPSGFVFCCFNNAYKITPATFDGWMRILARVEGSVLWLLEDNQTAVNNLRREAEARGIKAARLIFGPRLPLPEHLARHRAADLFLDTLPCNAHTTASDALWTGLPVLTQIGESFAARVAASLLNAIGLPELITRAQEQYETLAIELAHNPALLAAITEKLRQNRLSTPLFDTEQYARHLEDAYTQMCARYQADLNPEHIYVAR